MREQYPLELRLVILMCFVPSLISASHDKTVLVTQLHGNSLGWAGGRLTGEDWTAMEGKEVKIM